MPAFRFTAKGCLLGCLGAVAVFIAVVVLIGVWITRKGEFDVDRTILAENATAYLRANLRREDTTLIEFLLQQTDTANQASPVDRELPGFFRDWRDKQSRRDIENTLPLEVEALESGGEDLNVAVSFSIYNNLARLGYFFVKREARRDGRYFEHNKRGYVRFDDRENSLFLALHANTVFFARNREDLHAMLDRFEQEPTVEAGGPDARLDGLDREAPIYGFALTPGEPRPGQWFVEWAPQGGDRFWEAFERVGFDMNVDGQDTAFGTLVFDVAQPTPELKQALERALRQFSEDKALALSFELEERPGGYRAAYRVTGFQDWVRQKAANGR